MCPLPIPSMLVLSVYGLLAIMYQKSVHMICDCGTTFINPSCLFTRCQIICFPVSQESRVYLLVLLLCSPVGSILPSPLFPPALDLGLSDFPALRNTLHCISVYRAFESTNTWQSVTFDLHNSQSTLSWSFEALCSKVSPSRSATLLFTRTFIMQSLLSSYGTNDISEVLCSKITGTRHALGLFLLLLLLLGSKLTAPHQAWKRHFFLWVSKKMPSSWKRSWVSGVSAGLARQPVRLSCSPEQPVSAKSNGKLCTYIYWCLVWTHLQWFSWIHGTVSSNITACLVDSDTRTMSGW